MKKIGLFIILWTAIGLGWAHNAPAQPTAVRTMSSPGYTPGLPVVISIKITRSEPVDVTVVERPPAGWTISHVLPARISGINNGVITWNIPSSSLASILSYTVIPSDTAFGKAEFSGSVGDRVISGTSTIYQVEPEPIGIFQNQFNLGTIPSTSAEYDSQTGEYSVHTILGSGVQDVVCGHYLYCSTSGDCTIEAQCEVQHPGDNPFYHTAGITIFTFYDAKNFFSCVTMEVKGSGSPECYVFEANQSNLPYVLEFGSHTSSSGRFRIDRRGDVFYFYNFNPQLQEWKLVDTRQKKLQDPVCLGLVTVCGNNSYTQGVFRDVKLTMQVTPSAVKDWEVYQ
ncbi:MAG: hypothetical protein ACE15F_18110 [bacterium]